MNIGYVLDGPGWATATVVVGGTGAVMSVSHLHDSLGELASATLELCTGGAEATVVFMDEPGEHHLVLCRIGDALAVEVRWFDDWASWDIYPPDRYRVVLSGVCTFAVFRDQVVGALDRVLAEFGVAGYRTTWGENDFPWAAFEGIKHAEPRAAADGGGG